VGALAQGRGRFSGSCLRIGPPLEQDCTTLFLDRKGRVRRIYTGFSGPGTGEHYQKLIEDFDATVEQLLAETGDNTVDPPVEGV
jgi:hypothetical protein